MDMVIPETLPGIKDALISHMIENNERFTSMDSSLRGVWSELKALKKHEEEEKQQKEEEGKMASLSETINVGGASDNAAMMMAAMAGKGGGDGLFGTGGVVVSLVVLFSVLY